MNESTRKILKDLAVWLVTLPIAAGIFTAVVNLFVTPAKVGINFTPNHFGSPSLPLSPVKLFGGVLESFGAVSALMLALLLVLFFYLLAATLGEFREWSGGEKKAEPEQATLVLSPRGRVTVMKWGAALIIILVTVRIVVSQPLAGNVSAAGKFLLAGRFLASFNAGLLAKSSFREEEYTSLMLDALKFDRGEYMRFAESEYWAYFASKGVTARTRREKMASKELIRLFEEGLLEDDILERAAGVIKKAGETAAAHAVVEKLRNSK